MNKAMKTKKSNKGKADDKMVKRRPGKKNRGNRNPYQGTAASVVVSQGNEWWRLRSKHGRDKLFTSPQLLKEAAEEYFKYIDEHPDHMVKPMVVSNGGGEGSSVDMVKVPVKQPYTIQGLCGYLDCSTAYFRMAKQKWDKIKDADYFTVIAEIEDRIFNQQYSGAAGGHFNANIIARALGLVDRQDITTSEQPLTAPVINIYKGDTPPINEESKPKKKSDD